MDKEKADEHFILDFQLLRTAMPELERYFGVGWGYFTPMLDSLIEYLEFGEISHTIYQDLISSDYKAPVPYPIDINLFNSLFAGAEKHYKEIDHLKYSLLLLGFIFNEYINNEEYNQYCSENAFDSFVYNTHIRKDLLNLYLLINSPKTRNTRITIKCNTSSVDLGNYNNFFTQEVLKSYVDKHLPDITTIEQAEIELLRYKGRAGRSIEDIDFNVISYGIYKLFGAYKHHKKVADAPKELVELIKGYLQLLGAWKFEKDIKANLSYFKKREQHSGCAPKYDQMDLPQVISYSELNAPSTTRH